MQSKLLNNNFFDEFLKSGAFVRLSADELLLWSGPFSQQPVTSSNTKDPLFSVAYLPFFGPDAISMQSAQEPIRVMNQDLLRKMETLAEPVEGMIRRNNFKDPSKTAFAQGLQEIHGKIQRGEIEKAVPVTFSRCELRPTEKDLASWIKNLMLTRAPLIAYGMWDEEGGIMGATPEFLFKRDHGLLKSMALAGTCPRNELGTRLDILKDPKEMFEHQVVVKDIEARLKGMGWPRKSETQILTLPSLLHLVTYFEMEIGNKTSIELMRYMHPTPALGVSPRAYGYHWMKELPEQNERGLFGSPIAFQLSKDEVLCLVGIRNIQWSAKGCQVGAGCGIVKDSELEREWSELASKRSSVFSMLGL